MQEIRSVSHKSELVPWKISVILPAFNEEENLEACVRGVVETLSQARNPFEVIIVDDGSTDGTEDLARNLANSAKGIIVLSHVRNLGKTQAIKSGLEKSTGEIIVLMDADLQYDPKDILKLMELIEDGYDAVNGNRINRKDPFSKKAASKVFNWIAGKAFDLDVKDFNSGLKAFRREVLEEVEFRGDYHRFILAAVKANGYQVGEIPITHYARKLGKSKYGLKRLVLGSSDLISLKLETMLSRRPMLLFGTLSSACLLLGFSAGVYSLLTGGFDLRPSLLLSIAFILASIQFLSIGFLADLVVGLRSDREKGNFYED